MITFKGSPKRTREAKLKIRRKMVKSARQVVRPQKPTSKAWLEIAKFVGQLVLQSVFRVLFFDFF